MTTGSWIVFALFAILSVIDILSRRGVRGNVETLRAYVVKLEDRVESLECEEPPPIYAQPGYVTPYPSVPTMERNLNLLPGTLRCWCEEDAVELANETGEPLGEIPEVSDQGYCMSCGYPRKPTDTIVDA